MVLEFMEVKGVKGGRFLRQELKELRSLRRPFLKILLGTP